MSLICLFAPLGKESSPGMFSPAGGLLGDSDSGAANVSLARTGRPRPRRERAPFATCLHRFPCKCSHPSLLLGNWMEGERVASGPWEFSFLTDLEFLFNGFPKWPSSLSALWGNVLGKQDDSFLPGSPGVEALVTGPSLGWRGNLVAYISINVAVHLATLIWRQRTTQALFVWVSLAPSPGSSPGLQQHEPAQQPQASLWVRQGRRGPPWVPLGLVPQNPNYGYRKMGLQISSHFTLLLGRAHWPQGFIRACRVEAGGERACQRGSLPRKQGGGTPYH